MSHTVHHPLHGADRAGSQPSQWSEFAHHFTAFNLLIAVTNYHVKAIVSEDKLTLLYKLEPGVCDKSFGIDVAKLANFPPSVITDARKRIAKLEGESRDGEPGEERSLQTDGEVIADFLSRVKDLQNVPDGDLVAKFTAIKNEFRRYDQNSTTTVKV